MTDYDDDCRPPVCYEAMPPEVIREMALQRADEVEAHDEGLFIRLLHLSHSVGVDDPEDYQDTDYAALDERPDIPRWQPIDAGASVTLGGVEVRVGRYA